MKKIAIFALLAAFLAGPVWAERPGIDIEGDVVVDYAVQIDVDVNVDGAGGNINQFVDKSKVKAVSIVTRNDLSQSRKVKVDATAVGNTADLADGLVDVVVQSVQDSDVTALALVNRNLINPRANVKVTSLAVGNNVDMEVGGASITFNPPGQGSPSGPPGIPGIGIDAGGATVVQLVEGSNVTAVSTLNNNLFGCWWCRVVDPTVESTAVGNLANLTVLDTDLGLPGGIPNGVPFGVGKSPISVTQFTIKGSKVSALSTMIGNRGRIGPVNVNSTAIGNSVSVGSAGL